MATPRGRPLPWLAMLGAALAAVGAVLALPLPAQPAPVRWLAAACMLAAAVLAVLAGWRAQQQIHTLDAALARAALAETERNALQHDVHLRERLEHELLQAKQAAEAAVLAKGEFLATMSHEIRTPLNGIIPMLDLIGRGRLDLDQRDMLRAASDSSQQLLRIVDDILDYSKLEAQRLELEITTFNLRELLEGVQQLLQRSAEDKGLRMALHLDPAVRLPVRGDPLRLRQVLGNLLGNAIKFTARGSIDLRVRRLGETPAQHLLRFEVQDTGIGISAERQQRLFRAFAQADASTTRLYGGTGLGLAICKRIVDLMGGRIGVDSSAGQGATFWFEIPLLKAIGDLPQASGGLNGQHALLVGADARLAQRLALLLPNWGAQLSKVDSTQEALERLRVARPHYDLVIGDLDGLRQSARALQRAVARLPAVPRVRLVWLYGDGEIPAEIRAHDALLSRQAADVDLRSMLAPVATPAAPSLSGTAASGDGILDSMSVAVADTDMPAEAEAAPARGRGTIASAPPHSGYRLLLVEDNPVNLMVARRLLETLGHAADSAGDGAAALAQLARQSYDLVLMDCQMPVLDGYAATRQWRHTEAQTRRAHLPIVAMTANAMAGDRQRCLDAGMDDYLSKPIDLALLDACLRRWLPPAPVLAAGAAAADTDTQMPRIDVSALADAAPRAAASDPAALAHAPPDPAPAPVTDRAAHAGTVDQIPAAATPYPALADGAVAPADRTDAGAVPALVPGVATPPSPPAETRAPSPPPPVLEVAVLDELREVIGNADTAQIIEAFLDDAPLLIRRLEQAAADAAPAALREAAHTLKSAAANVGAQALSATASRIERELRAGPLERPTAAVALVIAEFARTRLALNGYGAALRDAAEGPAP